MRRFPLFGSMMIALASLASLVSPARADFVLTIQPSHPAASGALVLDNGNVVATNLTLSSVTDGVTVLPINKYLDFQTAGIATPGNAGQNFFVLNDVVEVAAGSPPLAMGIGGTFSLTQTGTIYHLLMTGLDSTINADIANAYHLDPAAHYVGSMSLDFVVNPALAGDQVIGGFLTLAPSVPEPNSVILAGCGLGLLGLVRLYTRVRD